LLFTEIYDCKEAASTPYCYPPNGTRLCMSSDNMGVAVHWPSKYYHPGDSRIALSTSPSRLISETDENNGTRSLHFNRQVYENDAVVIPGSDHERALHVWFLERAYVDRNDKTKGVLHEGPTLVLVRIREWTGNRTNETWPTVDGPAVYPFAELKDTKKKVHLGAGAIFGIVFGGVLVIAAVLLGLWRYHGRKKMQTKSRHGSVELISDVQKRDTARDGPI
jgi:hypothetical protein